MISLKDCLLFLPCAPGIVARKRAGRLAHAREGRQQKDLQKKKYLDFFEDL